MSDGTVHVVGFAGSLRQGSFNRLLLRAARDLAPEGTDVEIADLGQVPLYDYDVEAQGDPEGVAALKRRIAAADAVLITTPEYQHGMPGVLKNALDWVSRPPGRSPLRGKPVSVMGASPGMGGTARAQSQLRLVLGYNTSFVVSQPEVLVANAAERFDDQGRLTDETAATLIRQQLDGLADLVRRIR